MSKNLRCALTILVYALMFLFGSSMIILIYRWITINDRTAEPVIAAIEFFLFPPLIMAKNKLKHQTNDKPNDEVVSSINPNHNEDAFEAKVLKSSVVDSADGVNYRFQVDLSLYVTGRSIYIREIALSQNECVFSARNIKMYHAFSSENVDYLGLPLNAYKETVIALTGIPVQEIVVRNDERRYLTFTGFITGERLPDGYEKFLPKGWNFNIVYNDNIEKNIEFDFEIHPNSEKVPISYRYKNFL